jgi:hypothetical protein
MYVRAECYNVTYENLLWVSNLSFIVMEPLQ